MLNVPVNVRKFHGRKLEKSCPIDPYFLCGKILRNGIELRRDLYLSMRKLSNLSHFGNLSVEVFFGRRWSINITGAVTGNPRYHHLKNCIVSNCFKTLLQLTMCDDIEPPCLLCMLTLSKPALCSHLDLTRSKNPLEPP